VFQLEEEERRMKELVRGRTTIWENIRYEGILVRPGEQIPVKVVNDEPVLLWQSVSDGSLILPCSA
jgi:hypothetical protein